MTLNHGNPVAMVTFWEDFLRDNVTDLFETAANSGSQDMISKHGGWWSHTVSTGDTDDVMLGAELAWEADEGFPLTFETRLLTSDTSKSAIGIYMTDANTYSNAVLPIENEDGTQALTGATDSTGFLLEGEQDETWSAVGAQNSTLNTAVALTLGADSADSVIQVLRMELNPNSIGTALYHIGVGTETGGGRLVSTQTTWFRSSIVLVPMIGVNGRATALTVDYDYLYVTAGRS